MAGQRQPTALVIAKGKKNLTKKEIQERMSSEVQPITDNIKAPEYLTKKQREEFELIANQLKNLKIMGETDVDVLARYIISKELYIRLSKQLMKNEVLNDPQILDLHLKNQDRVFKQCRSSANDLGLSITSRCKLVVPQVKTEEKKENKFNRFKKGQNST